MSDSGIYIIRNTANGNEYVGSAVSIARRWGVHKHHLRNGKHHCAHLQRAWDKYGEDAFAFVRLLLCPRDMLIFFEQRAIDILEPTYNSARIAGSSLGVKARPEVREALSARKREEIASDPDAHRELTAKANEAMRALYADPARRAERNAKVSEKLREQFSKCIEFNGETRTRREWADLIGIAPSTLDHRIKSWGLEAALTTPATAKHSRESNRLRSSRKGLLYPYKGEELTATELGDALGVTRQAILYRLKREPLEAVVRHFEERRQCQTH